MIYRKGFTLIELLIVVAIIAILAAIAIPNFLAAQIRAKVTKSKGEMRNLATALESYFVDSNSYPQPELPFYSNVPNNLSTPISYITNSKSFRDPFSINATNPILQRYGYICADWRPPLVPTARDYWGFMTLTNQVNAGKWRMDGYGPFQAAPSYPNTPSYDPTNGTVSNGQIYRSQGDPEGKQI